MVLGNLGAALGQAGRPRDGARRHRQALALLAEDLALAEAAAPKGEVLDTTSSADGDGRATVGNAAATVSNRLDVESLRHQIAHTRVQLMTIRQANCCWRHFATNLRSLVAYVVNYHHR